MRLTPIGALFLAASLVLALKGSRPLFAGLLFASAFPSTAVLIVEGYEYGVQPYQLFSALYVLRVIADFLFPWFRGDRTEEACAPRRSIFKRLREAEYDTRALLGYTALWLVIVTVGSLLGAGPASALALSGVPRGVELLEQGKRVFHVLYLYLMVALMWIAYRETRISARELKWSPKFVTGPTGGINAVIRRVLSPMVWGAGASALWGVVQLVTYYLGVSYPLVFNNNPTFKVIADAVAGPFKQVNSTFPEPSMFAMFMVPMALLSAAWGKLELTVPLLSMATASFSTTGIVGLGLGALLAVAAASLERDKAVRRTLLITAGMMMALSMMLVAPGIIDRHISSSPVVPDVQMMPREVTVGGTREVFGALARKGLNKGATDSGQERLAALMGGVTLWLERPLLGWGAGTVRTKDLASNSLANLGLTGFVLLYGAVAWAAWKGVVSGAPVVSASLLVLVGLQSVAVPELNFPYVWILMGILVSLPSLNQGEAREAREGVLGRV